jgi:hypothetical protein
MAHFEFRIEPDGEVRKHPPTPWYVGAPKSYITVAMVNESERDHRIRMIKFKHKGTNKFYDPLTGTKVWIAFAHQSSRTTRHMIREDSKPGAYEFLTELDGIAGADPEIIVDAPPVTVKPKKGKAGVAAPEPVVEAKPVKKSASTRTAKTGRTATPARKAAKGTGTKRKTASKATKATKAKGAKKAKKAKKR